MLFVLQLSVEVFAHHLLQHYHYAVCGLKSRQCLVTAESAVHQNVCHYKRCNFSIHERRLPLYFRSRQPILRLTFQCARRFHILLWLALDEPGHRCSQRCLSFSRRSSLELLASLRLTNCSLSIIEAKENSPRWQLSRCMSFATIIFWFIPGVSEEKKASLLLTHCFGS